MRSHSFESPPSQQGLSPSIDIVVQEALIQVQFAGEWTLVRKRPDCLKQLEESKIGPSGFSKISFDGSRLASWDSSFLLAVQGLIAWAQSQQLEYSTDRLPEGVLRLLSIAHEGTCFSSNQAESRSTPAFWDYISKLGRSWLAWQRLVGELAQALCACLCGRFRFQRKDFVELVHETGLKALGIVSLLSFLTGLIIAFIGIVQLQKLGADLYVADLVGLAMTRELGALMVGVIMAGRTGAAFAAQIGTMRVNEELDAFESFSIAPVAFLVVPRVLASMLMLPLLGAWACLMGILGGLLVSLSLTDLGFIQYVHELQYAVSLGDFLGGLFKCWVFSFIVAMTGCFQGLQCGRDARSVGQAATAAVVSGITWIVLADAVLAISFNRLGI